MQKRTRGFGDLCVRFAAAACLLLLNPAWTPAQASGGVGHYTSVEVSAVRPSTPAPFVVTGLGKATVEMNGAWLFHPGDDLAWAQPDYDDSGWARIEAGKTWEEQGYRNLTGFAWYRRRIVLAPDSPEPSSHPTDWRLAFSLQGVEDAAEVYWNGRRVGAYGQVPPDPVWYDMAGAGQSEISPHLPAYVPLGRPEPGVLAIRVWKAPYVYYSFPNEGGLTGIPLLGSAAALAARDAVIWYRWLESDLYGLGLALIAGIVALLALAAWLRDRKQWMLLWLALYTVHPLALLPIVDFPGLLSFRWNYGLIAPVICVEDVALWFLLLYLLNLRDNPRLVHWTIWMSAIAVLGNFADGGLQLFQWTTWPGHLFLSLDVGFTIPALLVEAWGIVLVLFAFRKRLDVARWLLAITAMLADLVQALGNWFSQGARWTHWTLWKPFQEPLFSIGRNQFTAVDILNSLLLAAILYAVWRYQTEQSRRQNALDEELRNAQELQHVLVPETLPQIPGYAVSSAYRPAQVVGGDFFQIFATPGDAVLVVMGDVSGKGLKAAMTVALIVGAVRMLAETMDCPAEILAGLNRRLYGRMRGGFVTCVALRLDADGDCQVANAGHLPPFVNGEEMELPGALPLGLVSETGYATTTVRLAEGDRVVLYTDGLPEARNAAGELFGFERLRRLLAEDADASAVAETAVRFGQEDDVTVVRLDMVRLDVVETPARRRDEVAASAGQANGVRELRPISD